MRIKALSLIPAVAVGFLCSPSARAQAAAQTLTLDQIAVIEVHDDSTKSGIVKLPDRSLIYFLDVIEHRIYVRTLVDKGAGAAQISAGNAIQAPPRSLGTLIPWSKNNAVGTPVAIAASGGKLLVADAKEHRVWSYDPKAASNSMTDALEDFRKDLVLGDVISAHTRSISVDDKGRLCVAQDAGLITLFDGTHRIDLALNENIRKVSLGPDEIAILFGDKTLRRFRLTDWIRSARAKRIPSAVRSISSVVSFARSSEYLYAVLSDGVSVFPPSPVSEPITFPYLSKSYRLLTLTATRVYALQEDGETLATSPTLLPISVEIRGDPNGNDAAARLMLYALHRGTLPQRLYTAPKGFATTAAALCDANVAKADTPEACADAVSKSQDFGKLLYEMNSKTWIDAKSALSDRVEPGRVINIPGITYRKTRTIAQHTLTPKQTVKEYLTGFPDSQRYTNRLLTTLNPSSVPSLEATMNREQYLLFTPPRPPVAPGGGLVVKNGVEVVTDPTSSCLPDVLKSPDVTFPGSLFTLLSSGILPTEGNTAAAGLKSRGVERIELRYEGLSTTVLSKSSRCTEPSPTQPFIVGSVLSASRTYYRFVDSIGKRVPLTDGDFKSFAMAGRADPTGDWSLILDEPRSIAYRAGLASDPVARAVDPDSIKPESTQNILRLADVTLQLPTDLYAFEIMINRNDYDNPPTELLDLRNSPHIGLSALENLQFVSQAVQADDLAVSHQLIEVTTNREKLRELIGIPKDETYADNPLVGIVETDVQTCSFAFLEDDSKTSAWQQFPVGDPEGIPCDKISANLKPDGLAKIPLDHGMHVAGLLAGRSKDVPGILPRSKPFLVDTKDDRGIVEAMKQAVEDNGINVFNFSQLADKSVALDPLHERMTGEIATLWKNNVYVVSAGDPSPPNYDDKISGSVPPLLGYIGEFPDNIIGVAASDMAGDLGVKCAEDPSQPNDKRKISKVSRQYVQLVAPGCAIYSLGKDNRYVIASGSSMAVPQVSAAAVLLRSKYASMQPAQIKARLIYTSTFKQDYLNLSAGGMLNVSRAITEAESNLLATDASGRGYLVSFADNQKLTITKSNSTYDLSGMFEPTTKGTLSIQSVLRIQHDNETKSHWVVYLAKDHRMMIVNQASLEGQLKITGVSAWDELTKTFGNRLKIPASDLSVESGVVNVKDIINYVGKVPSYVVLK